MPGIINLTRGFVFKFPPHVPADWNEAEVKYNYFIYNERKNSFNTRRSISILIRSS